MNVFLRREILDRCNQAENFGPIDIISDVHAQFPQQGQGYDYQHPPPYAQMTVPHPNMNGQYLLSSQPELGYCPGPPHYSDGQCQSPYQIELIENPEQTQTLQSEKPQKRLAKSKISPSISGPLIHPGYAVNTRHDGPIPTGMVCPTTVR